MVSSIPEVTLQASHERRPEVTTTSGSGRKEIDKTWEKAQEIILKKYEIIKGLTDNTEVKGNYIESIIRSMIENWVKPYVVSNGVIVLDRELDYQIDGIIWERHRAPAFVEEGNFAAVLPDSVRGIAEIRSAANKSALEKLQKRLQDIRNKIVKYVGIEIFPYSATICGIVIRTSEEIEEELINKYSSDMHTPIFILFREINGEFEPIEGMLWKLANYIYKGLPAGGMYRPSMETP